jgi:hypothetical protein
MLYARDTIEKGIYTYIPQILEQRVGEARVRAKYIAFSNNRLQMLASANCTKKD